MSLITRILNQKRKKRIKIDGNQNNDNDENNEDLKQEQQLLECKENVPSLPRDMSASQTSIRRKSSKINSDTSYLRKFLCGCTRTNSTKSRVSNIIPSSSSAAAAAVTTTTTTTTKLNNKTTTTTTTTNTTMANQINIKIIEIKEENEILNVNNEHPVLFHEEQQLPECKIVINEIDDSGEKNRKSHQEVPFIEIQEEQHQTMGYRIMQSPEVVINEIRKISIKSTTSTKRRKSTNKTQKQQQQQHDDEDDDDDDDDYDDEENTSENDKFYDLKPPVGMKLHQHRGSHQPTTGNTYSVSDGYPKFLTANNILTDRGCIVNIRTGSFNLGCTPNNPNGNGNDTNQNNQMSSNDGEERGRSGGGGGAGGENSCSNNENSSNGNTKALIVPSLNISDMNYGDHDHHSYIDQDYDDENCDNFDENLSDYNYNQASNLLAASPNYNLLTANNEQLDPFRRCSHDPNIEKLHKTYINNVKLLDVPTPTTSIATLTAVTSSLSICKKSSSDSSFYNENPTTKRLRSSNLHAQNNKCKSSATNAGGNTDEDSNSNLLLTTTSAAKRDSLKAKSAELLSNTGDVNEQFNEISKVNEWLSDNHNHHQRRHSGNKAVSASNITTTTATDTTSATVVTTVRKSSRENAATTVDTAKDEKQQQQKKMKQKRKVTYIDEKTGQTLGTKIISQQGAADAMDADYDEDDDDDDYDDVAGGADCDDDDDDDDEETHKCKNCYRNDPATSSNKGGVEKSDSIRSGSGKNWKNYKSDTNSSNPTDQTTHDFETNDSAVDIESYDTMSSVSKASSKSRTHWQSFSKNYHLHFFHSTTWSKYQISAMSLDQIMALRKLALIQFSKLVERQHSSVIRTFRLFSKKRDVEEFKRVYDIDSTVSKNSNSNADGSNGGNDATNVNNKNSNSSALSYSKSIKNTTASLSKKQKSFINEDSSCADAASTSANAATTTTTSIGGTNCSSNNASNIATSAINSVSTTFNAITSSVSTSIRPCDLRASTVVFGLPLHIIMQRTGQPLPQKIIEAMKILRKLAPRAIGIFRKNGVKTRINKLKDAIDNNEEFNFHLFYTLYDIADMIKLYFRLLPECLITNKLSDILLANYSKVSPEERKLILQQVMLLIPDESRLALQTLLLFLNDIAKHAKTNQMTRSNLAVCFSPVLFHLNVETKKKKLYNRKQRSQQQQQLDKTASRNALHESNKSLSITENSVSNNDPPSSSTLNVLPSQQQAQTSSGVTLSVSREQSPMHSKKSLIPQQTLENYKRKCSQTLNKAASSIANFSAGIVDINSSTYSNANTSYTDNIENLSRVGQLCVADMIKYSMDLFTVPINHFEKLKLSLFYGSEPYDFEYYYDRKENKLKKEDYFKSNLNMQKLYWSYYDKYEDISIYYYKNEQLPQGGAAANQQQDQNFNEKLKLWKCCTLIKQQNINLEKILQRIANERLLWDDDFKEGRLIEKLDDNTDTYKYVISLMPPHPSRDFTEIRHWSKQNDSTLIYTTTSIKSNDRLIGDIRANMIMSKYIIEKLIDNESVNTFKITHLMKLDYKGFTIEFYNKSLGYLMARLLHRLKLSFTN